MCIAITQIWWWIQRSVIGCPVWWLYSYFYLRMNYRSGRSGCVSPSDNLWTSKGQRCATLSVFLGPQVVRSPRVTWWMRQVAWTIVVGHITHKHTFIHKYKCVIYIHIYVYRMLINVSHLNNNSFAALCAVPKPNPTVNAHRLSEVGILKYIESIDK